MPVNCQLPGRAAHVGFIENPVSDEPGIFPNFLLDAICDLRIGLEKILGVFPALSEPLAVIGEPGSGFFDDAGSHAKIDQFA